MITTPTTTMKSMLNEVVSETLHCTALPAPALCGCRTQQVLGVAVAAGVGCSTTVWRGAPVRRRQCGATLMCCCDRNGG